MKQRFRKWEPNAVYGGWIAAPESMRQWFIDQGLDPKVLRYNNKEGVFEYCQGDANTIKRLHRLADVTGKFHMGGFTALDSNGKQYPKSSQPFWAKRTWSRPIWFWRWFLRGEGQQ